MSDVFVFLDKKHKHMKQKHEHIFDSNSSIFTPFRIQKFWNINVDPRTMKEEKGEKRDWYETGGKEYMC